MRDGVSDGTIQQYALFIRTALDGDRYPILGNPEDYRKAKRHAADLLALVAFRSDPPNGSRSEVAALVLGAADILREHGILWLSSAGYAIAADLIESPTQRMRAFGSSAMDYAILGADSEVGRIFARVGPEGGTEMKVLRSCVFAFLSLCRERYEVASDLLRGVFNPEYEHPTELRVQAMLHAARINFFEGQPDATAAWLRAIPEFTSDPISLEVSRAASALFDAWRHGVFHPFPIGEETVRRFPHLLPILSPHLVLFRSPRGIRPPEFLLRVTESLGSLTAHHHRAAVYAAASGFAMEGGWYEIASYFHAFALRELKLVGSSWVDGRWLVDHSHYAGQSVWDTFQNPETTPASS